MIEEKGVGDARRSGTSLAIIFHLRSLSTINSLITLGDSSITLRLHSGTRRQRLALCSGIVSTTPRPWLKVWFPRLHLNFDSHTVEGSAIFLRPCYKAHTLPSSKLGGYIGTMHLSVHLSIKFPRRFILDPGTTCLRHLLPGSGTKWAHFTLR
jgi:hypothetical protein